MSYTVRNLIIAAALAVVGMVLVGNYLQEQRRSIEKGNEFVKVLVADKDIPAGTEVNALESGDYLRTERILKRNAQPQALKSLKPVGDLAVNRTIFVGDQLTARSFANDAGLKLADQIKGNERQLAIPVGAFQSVGGQLKPGDRVDIFASNKLKLNGKDDDVSATWVAARNVQIVSTPQSRVPEGEEAAPEPIKAGADPEVYVVQVTDRVAMDLVWSFSHSDEVKLQMVLRPGDGSQETNLPPQTAPPRNS